VSDAAHFFEQTGALLRGHFTYTSGRHGAEYLEKFRLLENPEATTALCGMIVAHFTDAAVELVAGPTTGGIILAYEVARQMGVCAVYAERGEAGGRVLRRGFRIRPAERVLVVDDIVTTGGSVQDMLNCVAHAGGTAVGVGVLGDRTGGRMAVAIPVFACLTVDFPSYLPSECPLCAAGIPLSARRGTGAAAAVR
jgi:orotate phosphoribosyltransferase